MPIVGIIKEIFAHDLIFGNYRRIQKEEKGVTYHIFKFFYKVLLCFGGISYRVGDATKHAPTLYSINIARTLIS